MHFMFSLLQHLNPQVDQRPNGVLATLQRRTPWPEAGCNMARRNLEHLQPVVVEATRRLTWAMPEEETSLKSRTSRLGLRAT